MNKAMNDDMVDAALFHKVQYQEGLIERSELGELDVVINTALLVARAQLADRERVLTTDVIEFIDIVTKRLNKFLDERFLVDVMVTFEIVLSGLESGAYSTSIANRSRGFYKKLRTYLPIIIKTLLVQEDAELMLATYADDIDGDPGIESSDV